MQVMHCCACWLSARVLTCQNGAWRGPSATTPLLLERPTWNSAADPTIEMSFAAPCMAAIQVPCQMNGAMHGASPARALHGLVPCEAALQAPLTLLNVFVEGVTLALSPLPLKPPLLLTHFGGIPADERGK